VAAKAPLNEELFGTLTDSEPIDVDQDEDPQFTDGTAEEKWGDSREEAVETMNGQMEDEHFRQDDDWMGMGENMGENIDHEDEETEETVGKVTDNRGGINDEEVINDEELEEEAKDELNGNIDISTLMATMAKRLVSYGLPHSDSL